MIPIKDDNPTVTLPLMTVLLIVVNVAVFVCQWMLGPGAEAFVFRMGVIPWELTHLTELPHLPASHKSGLLNVTTPLTAMFIHGDLFHLLGNMLYLWIFGDNVEALTGHGRFLLFYLICGLAATTLHVVIDPNSTLPMVGASGAISGVLGAYLIRFPRAKVHVLVIFFFFIRIIRISALFVLGFWFLMQIWSGLGTLGISGGGVAWFAHIGGFLTGLVLVFAFDRRERVRVVRGAGWR